MRLLKRLLVRWIGGLLMDEVNKSRSDVRMTLMALKQKGEELADANSRLLAVQDDLAAYKAAVAQKDAELRVLQAENELLWKLDQRNTSRIDMERAQAHRAIAEAETARVARISEQDLE